MKQLLKIFVFCVPILSFGQSIFSNAINGIDPSLNNPFTDNQIVDPNITVSGIGRGTAIFGLKAKNRYDAKSWKSDTLDPNAYFEFTLTPNAGKGIQFVSFVYNGKISTYGPRFFAFRSSVDNFTTDIGSITANGATVSLNAPVFQNVSSSITFRIYGWGATMGTGAFSINDFKFNGIVTCLNPQAPTLAETSLGCNATSFDLQWATALFTNNYFIDVAKDPGFVNFVSGYHDKELGNVLVETVSGLEVGKKYYVRLRSKNDCGISANSNTIEVSPLVTVYNNGWSNGDPDLNKNVQFLSDYNLTGLLEACSCQINNGVSVQINPNAILKIENELNVEGSGTLIFENNASLVQVNDVAINTGNIIYKRNTSLVKNFDYVYWSSPVKNQKLNLLVPTSSNFYSFSGGNWFPEATDNFMNPEGKGFISMVPQLNTIYNQSVQFIGVPNNGAISIPSQGYAMNNLIGNPYASAIDADLFITNANNSNIIDGALYFWTHNTPRTLVGSQYQYTSNDYATYTLVGGTKTGIAALSGGLAPSGQIAAGQAFFVGSKIADGHFDFNNSMRISALGGNSQFFKQASPKKSAAIEKNRVWLNLTNDQGAFKQLLVGYVTGATNDLDQLYDGVSFDGNTYVDFYSINSSKNLTIQGRGLPFDEADQVPLGYKTTISGTFQISIDNVDGALVNQEVYLEDKKTSTVYDLTKGAYSFMTAEGEFKDRFVLRYTNTSKLGTGDFDAKGKGVIVSVKSSKIRINSFDQNISSIKVYDLKESLLYEKNKLCTNDYSIDNLVSSTQFMVVKIQLEDGKWVSKEIIFHD